MTRIANLLTWTAGAIVSALGYWYVVVYLLNDFNRGYGQRNWFQLNLYLSLIFTGAGLVGYAAVTMMRRVRRPVASTMLAGVAFMLGVRVLAFALGLAYPDRDTMAEILGGALMLGALSPLVARPNAK